MENNREKEEKVNTYRFIENKPCGKDLFEGKSHERIAEQISELLINDNSCKLIGLDGGWGSGKSNLIQLVENKLKDNKFKFFIYDAWGHQEDSYRRSLLEELVESLVTNGEVINKEKWQAKLKGLLAKTREIEKKVIPKISIGIIISGLAIILTPILGVISESIVSLTWRILILALPLIVLFSVFLRYLISEFFFKDNNCRKRKVFENALNRMFRVYSSREVEDTTLETISEDEPSARKFRGWMNEISDDLAKKKAILVVVFDNMDRLQKQKVRELWSSIHVFFAEEQYENIRVIVPFDRVHIISAFKPEDLEEYCKEETKKNYYGDDFINKTFNVVYRVSPPLMTDWKRFFREKWIKVFGEDDLERDDLSSIIQIFEFLSRDITPRKIIAFINEFASIIPINDTVPGKYIALFILGNKEISKKPIEEIINPGFLGSLNFLFRADENLSKYLASIYYQIEPERAIQVVFNDKLKTALNENDSDLVKKISNIPSFYDLLSNSITGVVNIENAVLSINEVDEKSIGGEAQVNYIWNCIYQKAEKPIDSVLRNYQKILLKKLKDRYLVNYVRFIIDGFTTNEKFNAVAYCESISEMQIILKSNLDVFDYLNVKQTNVQDFVSFVEKSQSEYKKYKIDCDKVELENYLIKQAEENPDDIIIVPYIKAEYPTGNYLAKLKELFKSNSSSPGKVKIVKLLRLIKEIEKPISVKLEDNLITEYFQTSKQVETGYYDWIAMRLSKFDKFNTQFAPLFNQVLVSSDSLLVSKLSECIEFYTTYGNLLLQYKLYGQYLLYKSVARELTNNPRTKSKADLTKILPIIHKISSSLEIDVSIILDRFKKSNYSVINASNIKDVCPFEFFEISKNVENELVEHCKNELQKYLDSLSSELWKDFILQLDSYEFKLSFLIEYKYSPEAVTAIREILKEIASGKQPLPDKAIWNDLILKLKSQNKGLISTFKSVRDIFCNSSNITGSYFKFFGDWLFTYGRLEEKKESLRTIFVSEVLNDSENISLILNNKEIVLKVFNKSKKEDRSEFIEKLQSLVKDSSDERLLVFAKEIGVEVSSDKEGIIPNENQIDV